MIVILAEAEREFLDDADYYERKEAGLGIRFRNEVATVVDWISLNFELPRVRPKGYRRVNLRVFPHYVTYVVRDETIWIVAISHGLKRPEHWIERI